jgi:creatinine amidohydrolase/Fe(II)-dependent formamide hydrolase-like protein
MNRVRVEGSVRWTLLTAFLLAVASAPAAAAPPSVELEALTWTELRDAVKAGATTVIIPAGGTEQNGPHIALGKHNVRARLLSAAIAQALGDTLVAPVVAYTPEEAGHQKFAGTISVPAATFKSLVESAARSLRQAGFTHVVLLGDHGGYQPLLKEAAAALNKEWNGSVRAHYIEDYYRAAQTAYVQALRAKGLSAAQIGTHAGAADTSLTLAIDPSLVRRDRLSGATAGDGTQGDPSPSSAALGQLGVDLIVSQTVSAIRKARAEKH